MLDRAGVAPERRRFERSVDARYERQSYELSVPVPARTLDAAALREIAEAFHDRHRQTYGHDNRAEPVQLVSVRARRHRRHPAAADPRQDGARRHRCRSRASAELWFRDTGAVERDRLRPRAHAGGARGAGPGRDRVAGIRPSSCRRAGRRRWTTTASCC